MTEQCNINKELLPVKVHYFLFNGANAGVISFVPVYAQQLGISANVIGIILAVTSCLKVLTKATFGGIVDRFQNLKQVLLFLILVHIAADLGLYFIPKPHQTAVNVTEDNSICDQGNLYIVNASKTDCKYYIENSTVWCAITCSLCQYGSPYCVSRNETSYEFADPDTYGLKYLNLNNLEDTPELHIKFLREKDSKCSDSCFDGSEYCESIAGTNPQLQLWLLSCFVFLLYIANGSVVSLSNAACYNALGDQPQNFGKQRMWGTIGWGSFALLTGYLNQVFTGTSKIYSYSSGFYILIVLFSIDLFVITKLSLKEATVSKNIYKDVGNMLVKPRILLFLFGVYGIGIVAGISNAYVFWYLRTTLNASQLILGCTSGVQFFFGELPFLFFSGLIIRKLGHTNTFTMSFLAYGSKLLCYSFLTDPWCALPVELLQGPSFGSFYAAMTSYSLLISPAGTEATMQGIVSGTFEGLGIATGSLLGGFCINNYGGRETFFWTGLVCLAVGLLHWMVHCIKDYKRTAGYEVLKMS